VQQGSEQLGGAQLCGAQQDSAYISGAQQGGAQQSDVQLGGAQQCGTQLGDTQPGHAAAGPLPVDHSMVLADAQVTMETRTMILTAQSPGSEMPMSGGQQEACSPWTPSSTSFALLETSDRGKDGSSPPSLPLSRSPTLSDSEVARSPTQPQLPCTLPPSQP
jgi:hypothetical protein